MIFKWLRDRRASRLWSKGLAHIRAEEPDAALAVGKKLLAMKFSGGYELVALAHQQKGELQPAIDILEEGVAKAPSVWLLWQLLGNLRDDSGDHERALDAYAQGLTCSPSDKGSLHFNRAVTLGRMRRFDEALAELEKVKPHAPSLELQRSCMSQGVYCLVESGRGSEAVGYVRRAIEEIQPKENERPALLVELGWAHWQGDRDAAAARQAIVDAVQLGTDDKRALLLLRTIDGRPLAEGFEFELMVCGRSGVPLEDGRTAGFIRTVTVATTDPEAALRWAATLEPESDRASLRIEESTVVGPVEAGTIEGLYWHTGRAYFPEEKGE